MPRITLHGRALSALTAMAALAAGACSDGGILGPGEEEAGTLLVDASADWAYVRLGDVTTTVTVADPATSPAWDLAFFGTTVMLNGGAAGPGGVRGYCVCQNRGATDAEVLAMTPGTERGDFEAVTASSIPAADSLWSVDALSPAISGWYAYDVATHQITAAPNMVWKVRMAEASNPAYAKLRVIDIEGAARTSPGRVTIEYAVQPAAGAAMGPTRTAVLDGSGGGRVYFDLGRGVSGDAADWDIALDGFAIRLNSGVSGSGRAGAVLAGESFGAMTDASDAPAQVYRADAYGGVFDAHRWYRYNLTGQHDVTPTYDVYLIRRGEEVWKVQLIGYYNTAGDARRITFRYARVTG